MKTINTKPIENEIMKNNSLVRISAGSTRLIKVEIKSNKSEKTFFGETIKQALKNASNSMLSIKDTKKEDAEGKTQLDKAILNGGEMYIYLNENELYNVYVKATNSSDELVYVDCETNTDNGLNYILEYVESWAKSNITVRKKGEEFSL